MNPRIIPATTNDPSMATTNASSSLSSSDPFERQLLAEILANIVSVCAHDVRRYIMSGPLPSPPSHIQGSKIRRVDQMIPSTVSTSNLSIDPSNASSNGNQNHSCFLYCLIIGLIDGDDVAVIEHLMDVIRYLLEPDFNHRPHVLDQSNNQMGPHPITPENAINSSNANAINITNKQEYEKFLGIYYEHYIHWLLVPFVEPNEPQKPIYHPGYFAALNLRQSSFASSPLPPSVSSASLTSSGMNHSLVNRSYHDEILSILGVSRRCILELFTLCVYRHAYRMKYFVMRFNVLTKFNRLLILLNSCPTNTPVRTYFRHLQSHIVKFWRAIISSKDEFYYRHIIKLDALQPLIDTLVKEIESLQVLQMASTIIATSNTKKIQRCQESLVASSIVELLLFLGQTSQTLLIYFGGKYLTMLLSRINDSTTVMKSFLDVLNHLQLKYEQIMHPNPLFPMSTASLSSASTVISQEHHVIAMNETGLNTIESRKRNREYLEQGMEEAYFEGNDDDDDEASHDMNHNTHNSHELNHLQRSNNHSHDTIDPNQSIHGDNGRDGSFESKHHENLLPNTIVTMPLQQGKDSLQLLADFYADYESDDESIEFFPATTTSTSSTAAPSNSHAPNTTTTNANSPMNDEYMGKRRRIAILRDLVDFGVSGTTVGLNNHSPTQSQDTSISSRLSLPVHDHLSPNANANMNALSSHPVHSSNSPTSNDAIFESLPPIKSKYEDDDDLTADEFLARAAKYKTLSNRQPIAINSSRTVTKTMSLPSMENESNADDKSTAQTNYSTIDTDISSSDAMNMNMDAANRPSTPISFSLKAKKK